MELYKKYRPANLKQVVGQDDAVKQLQMMLVKRKVPHTLLFTGNSGCGKTTLARIVKDELGCGSRDCKELNAADFRGIDMVRDIRQRIDMRPISGTCRVWIIDEAGKITSDAQNALLKILEDTPSHVYFMLCTTEHNKLIKTIHTRATRINVNLLPSPLMIGLVNDVLAKEKNTISKDVMSKLIDAADGSPRKALVILDQVIDLRTEAEQLGAINPKDAEAQAIEIARALINPKTTWKEMAVILKKVDEDPEGIRRMILGYATSVVLGGGGLAPIASALLGYFLDNFFDSGKAGLVHACYEVLANKR